MKSSSMHRRDLLRLGGLGLTTGLIQTQLHAWSPTTPSLNDCKGLVLFLRGGNDGINTLIPSLDPSYTSRRGGPNQLAIPLDQAIDLGHPSGALLHPRMGALGGLYSEGKVALMHRTHFDDADLSHFTNQRVYETTDPTIARSDGYAAPLLEKTSPSVLFRGASVSPGMQRAFITQDPSRLLAHIPSVENYRLDGFTGADKLEAYLSSHYGLVNAPSPEDLVRRTGQVMLESVTAVAGLLPGADYIPPVGVQYPTGPKFEGFANQLKEAIQMLKSTSCRLVGVELGGFDNHSNQAVNGDPTSGTHADNLRAVSQALTAVQRDWEATGGLPPLLSLCMSEFGRTNSVNGSRGTDHGRSSLMIAVGSTVNGGVYNMDQWNTNLMAQSQYIPHLTDFRTVLAEAFDRHFGVDNLADLDEIIEDWANLAGTGTKYQYLNYLS